MLKLVSILLLIKILTVESCIEKFRDAMVIPDIIDEFEVEEMIHVNVSFLEPIECGVQLTPNEVRIIPDVDWNGKNDDLYTILMTDGGAHDKKFMEVKHWLVINIPGSDMSKGKTLIEFIGAMPPEVNVN